MATQKLNHDLFVQTAPYSKRKIFGALGLVAAGVLVYANWDVITKTDAERFQEAYDAGSNEEAIALAVKLAEADPASARAKVGLAAAYIQKALNGKDFDASLAAARAAALAATEFDPSDAEAWRALGYTYELGRDVATAAIHYQRAVNLAPKSADALTQRGNALLAEGDIAGAEAQFQAAVNADSYNPQARLLLAQVRLARGDQDTFEIERLMEPVLGSGIPLLVADAKATLSGIRLAKKEPKAAEVLAREAVADAPGSASANLALGEALYDGIFSRQLPWDATLSEVRQIAARVAEIDPSRAAAPFLAFRAASAAGDVAAASVHASETIRLLDADPTISPAQKQEIRARIEFTQNVKVNVTSVAN